MTDPLTFWAWLEEVALQSFYPENSYNDDKPRWWEQGFTADMQSVLVSPPSLIQARVKQGGWKYFTEDNVTEYLLTFYLKIF